VDERGGTWVGLDTIELVFNGVERGLMVRVELEERDFVLIDEEDEFDERDVGRRSRLALLCKFLACNPFLPFLTITESIWIWLSLFTLTCN